MNFFNCRVMLRNAEIRGIFRLFKNVSFTLISYLTALSTSDIDSHIISGLSEVSYGVPGADSGDIQEVEEGR